MLERARLLAERGRGIVEPNPLVGALALQGGRVVGEGWHRRYGGPHAEEVALEAALVAGADPDTVVVTLEPCSSGGPGKRRPACTSLLLEAGVRTVAVGLLDPDPRHAGRALEILSEQGVQVLGPFPSPELEALLVRFRRALDRQRPWVVAKWAMTLDGKTATRTGSSRWISGDEALDWAHELRAASDGVLVGIRTALEDDPQLTVRRVNGIHPLRIVLDAEAVLDPACRLFEAVEQAGLLVVCAEGSDETRRAALESKGAQVVCVPAPGRSPSGRPLLDMDRVLALLRQDFGLRRVLVEGGGETLAQFFVRNAIDEVATCVAPKLVGGRHAASPLGGIGLASMSEAKELCDVRIDTLGSCVRIVGFVENVEESCAPSSEDA